MVERIIEFPDQIFAACLLRLWSRPHPPNKIFLQVSISSQRDIIRSSFYSTLGALDARSLSVIVLEARSETSSARIPCPPRADISTDLTTMALRSRSLINLNRRAITVNPEQLDDFGTIKPEPEVRGFYASCRFDSVSFARGDYGGSVTVHMTFLRLGNHATFDPGLSGY